MQNARIFEQLLGFEFSWFQVQHFVFHRFGIKHHRPLPAGGRDVEVLAIATKASMAVAVNMCRTASVEELS